ncbi:MAG TPA: response regulator [Actinomycetota bacterium]|nr:response regulator [Actinomycetota bacterium]
MAPSAARGATSRTRVMIVDDDPLIRGVVRAVLEDQDYELEEAASGEEALRLAERHPPSLVLLDVMMPGMNGFEVAERFKSDPNLKAAVIVMLTAKDAPEDRVRGMDAGADVYFTKPFSPLELLTTVNGALK